MPNVKSITKINIPLRPADKAAVESAADTASRSVTTWVARAVLWAVNNPDGGYVGTPDYAGAAYLYLDMPADTVRLARAQTSPSAVAFIVNAIRRGLAEKPAELS